jgi:peptidoglycan/xylan/chitin deacetylase (PgdA/CDA1 family)
MKKRSVVKILVASLLTVGILLSVGLTGAAKVFSGSSVRKMPICSVDTGEEKKIALTFDASWGAEKTPAILETLKKHGAKATYFIIGTWAEKYPAELNALNESGIVEIGTHSNTHPHMPKLSQKQIDLELSTSASIISNAIGKPVDLFRAPYGEYSDAVINAAQKQKLTPVKWSVDSLDWQDASSFDITDRVMKSAISGGIILLHNDGKNTLEALPALIEGLKNKGYSLTTVGDMIIRDNYTVDENGKQIKRG